MKPRLCLAYLALGGSLLFGQYGGSFDQATCSNIGGWAWVNTEPNTPISVDIYDGAVYVTSAQANQYRAGLPGNGYHAFNVPTPSTLKDNQIHNIYVRYGGTTIDLTADLSLGNVSRPLQCDSSSTGYTYYYTDIFGSINTANWTQNGAVSLLPGWGLQATGSGGSLISKLTPGGPSTTNYEVAMTLSLKSSGGVYVAYVRASSNALSSALTGTGTYVSVELQNPTFNSSGACTATLAGFQSINGTVTQLYSTPVVCHDGMQIRVPVVGSAALTSVDGLYYGFAFNSQIASGMPGIGGRSMPSTNAITMAELGPWDNVAPSPVNSNSFTTGVSIFAWQGAVDNPNGTGVLYYYICRNPGSCFWAYTASFEDGTQQPNTTYTYSIEAVDYHGNASTPTNLTVAVPAAGSGTNARRGLRPTNQYWGGAGEQIDVFGGNLNYSIPLITAIGRGGLRTTFNLTYNSQNWWVGSGTTSWAEGVDVGYGFGWQLMLGSIMPAYANPSGMEYMYSDASGALYRMVIKNGTVWAGTGSFYAWYDSNTNRLWFRDGSFWLMGCVSAGGEPDAGTMYPTLVEDSNGNQIIIHYMQGAGAYWNDSSARIASIEDARAVSYTDPGTGDTLYHSYAFTYNTGGNGLQYLSGITSYVGTPETYYFTILTGKGLYSPAGVSFGTASLLESFMVSGLGYTYNFTYDTTLNDGDLTEVTFPQGGHLRWAYTNCTYPGPVTIREVQYRYLQTSTQGEETYTFTPGNGTSTTLDDPTGAERYWVYNAGWLGEIQYRPSKGATPVRHEYYTWVQNPTSLNFYIGTLKTVLDETQPYSQTTETVQTQDSYGNVLTTQIYDYGNLNTPARTYTNTYLYQNNGNYLPLYIYNRLATSTVSNGSTQITLVQNQYDQYGGLGGPSMPNGQPREWDSALYGAEAYNNVLAEFYGTYLYRGNVTSASTPGRTVNTSYDVTGTVTSQNDSSGHSVNVTTSAATNFTLPDKLDPNGTGQLPTEITYNFPNGTGQTSNFLPASVAGPNQTLYNPTTQTGTAAYTSYDSYGRVSYTLAPSQSSSTTGARTNYSYTYPASGGWTITATTANTSGGNHWTTTTLDGIGRTASVTTGYNSTTVSEVDTQYAPCACGPLGKKSWQSQPYLPPNAAPPGTTYTYDALGRTVNVLLADGASHTTYTYQGNFTTVTDPATKWKQYASDAFGNLVTVIEPDPLPNPSAPNPPPAYPVTAAPSNTLLTSYTYDLVNHLTYVAMPRSTANGMATQTRTFVYDPTTQRLTSATNPENGTVSYTYNTDGTLATKLDANGNTETYTYDSYGRLTAIPDRYQTFTWDTCPANAIGCANAPGQMVQAAFSGFSSYGQGIGPNQLTFAYNYAYTPAGKVLSKTLEVQSANHFNYLNGQQIPANGTVAASYTYDNQGAQTQMSYAPFSIGLSSYVLTYTLDAMERPTGLTDNNNNTWASGVTYNPANQTNLGSRTYNNLLQVTRAGQMAYAYSATQNNGQIVSSTDAVTGETITYQYDALKRLSKATSSQNWVENYVYDGWGNLIQMNPTGTAGPPSFSLTVALDKNGVPNNQITAAGHDNNGNQAPLGTYVYYDVANRITQVGQGPGSYYAYDSDNRRIYYRDTNNNETIYFYGADGNKLAGYTVSYVTVNGTAEIQFSLAQGYDSNRVYFTGILLGEGGSPATTDRLGSVRTGPGYLNFQAYPYGVEYGSGTVNDRVKYATYTRDSLTGFDYAVNRYYASNWGRFLSPDPSLPGNALLEPKNWNKYAYVGGDPVNKTDPMGLCSPDDDPPCYSTTGVGFAPIDLASSFQFNELYLATFTGAWNFMNGAGGGGGGGGGAGQPFNVNHLPGFAAAESLTLAALALPDCAKLFGLGSPSMNPSALLASAVAVSGTGAVTALSFGSTGAAGIEAVTDYAGQIVTTTDPWAYASANGVKIESTRVTININVTNWDSGSTVQRAQTLIHELGHVFDMLLGAGGSSFVYDALPNGQPDPAAEAKNAALTQNCIKD